MQEENSENQESSSEVWNVSANYVKMVMTLIEEFNKLDTLVVFGYSDLSFDIMNQNENLRMAARLKALPRQIHSLQSLIRSSKFLLKKKTKNNFDEHYIRLIKISKNIWKLRQEKKRGNRVVELTLNEQLFDKIYDEILKIFADVMEELNKIGLIFPKGEERDVKILKAGYNKRFLTRT